MGAHLRAVALAVAVAFGSLSAGPPPLAAADFAYADFELVDGLHFQGVSNQTQDWLRLTPSRPGTSGAVWFHSKQTVIGGFSTEFRFRITLDDDQALPGPCKFGEQQPKSCARRGGDGLVFVLHNSASHALGEGGADLGYGGIANGVAVELDTWFDAHARDPYENHVAVLTRGRELLRSDHGSHLGSSLGVPDLLDGEAHAVRVEYDPEFHAAAVRHPSFQAAPHLASLVYPKGVAWKHGLGTLRVFVDHLDEPALTVPLNLGAILDLDAGRAWVGFTSSTGAAYQNHDVLSWRFLERKAESFSTAARAGAHLRPDQDAPPQLGARWGDPLFHRTNTLPEGA